MRQVKVFKYNVDKDNKYKRSEHAIASFHSYGLNYYECQAGIGHETTAIVEYDNGVVENVPLDMIQFIK